MRSTALVTSAPGGFGPKRLSIRNPGTSALPNLALQADDRLPRPHGLGRPLAAERQVVSQTDEGRRSQT
jgi:hypothetical protein